MTNDANIRNRTHNRAWRACIQASFGLVGIVTVASCAGQTGSVARGRECPVALRDAHVLAEQRPQDVLVRVTAPAGGNPEAIRANAEMIAEALSRHSQTAGASQQVRPAPGREVRVTPLPDGVELSFSSTGVLGMEVLRRRINDRVLRWQNGDCPSLDHTLETPQVTQTPAAQNADIVSMRKPQNDPTAP